VFSGQIVLQRRCGADARNLQLARTTTANNWVDEDVVPPGDACNPPGLGAGVALQGNAKAGHFQCQGAVRLGLRRRRGSIH